MDILQETGELPPRYGPHKLVGDYEGCWECHLKPDWPLVWKQNDESKVLAMIDTGSHSDIF